MSLFKSVRIQIIFAFLVITLLTVFLITSINYLETKKFLDNQLNRELDNTADLIEKNIENKLGEVSQLVLTIAGKEELREFHKEKIQGIIENFIEFADIFFNIYVYNKDGYLISAAYFDKRPYSKYLGENFNNYNNVFSKYAAEVLSDGTPGFSETFRSKSNKLIVTYIAPVTDGKDIKGLVSCAIYVQNIKLQRLLDRLKPPYNGFIYLMDQKGNSLGFTGTIPFKEGTLNINDLLNEKKLKLKDNTYRYKLNKVKITNIYVLVAVSDTVALNLFQTYRSTMIIYTLLSMAAVIFISILFASLFLRPVSLLVEGLKEVGKGNYSFRVNIKATGEIQSAISAFNEMAGKLQKNRIIEKIWIENWKE